MELKQKYRKFAFFENPIFSDFWKTWKYQKTNLQIFHFWIHISLSDQIGLKRIPQRLLVRIGRVFAIYKTIIT